MKQKQLNDRMYDLRNKVLGLLTTQGITSVEIQYSGCGDEGSITALTIQPPAVSKAALTSMTGIFGRDFGENSWFDKDTEFNLRQLLTDFGDHVINDVVHGGFETEEGGGGNLKLDVATGAITAERFRYLDDDGDSSEEMETISIPGPGQSPRYRYR